MTCEWHENSSPNKKWTKKRLRGDSPGFDMKRNHHLNISSDIWMWFDNHNL